MSRVTPSEPPQGMSMKDMCCKYAFPCVICQINHDSNNLQHFSFNCVSNFIAVDKSRVTPSDGPLRTSMKDMCCKNTLSCVIYQFNHDSNNLQHFAFNGVFNFIAVDKSRVTLSDGPLRTSMKDMCSKYTLSCVI